MADEEEKLRKKYQKYLEKKEWKESDTYKQLKESQKKDPLRRLKSPLSRGIGALISKDEREVMKDSFKKKKEQLEGMDKGRVGKIMYRLAPKTTRLLAGKKAVTAIEERVASDKQLKEAERIARMSDKEKQKLIEQEVKEKEKLEKMQIKLQKREARHAKFQERKEKFSQSKLGKGVGLFREAARETDLGILEPLRLLRRHKKEKSRQAQEAPKVEEVVKAKKIKCHYCGVEIPSNTKTCPYCGALSKEQRKELEKFAEDYTKQEFERQMKEIKGK